jgi:phenylacetate-coenzyme A ligase PaaK-like adenylate-forming protein
VRGRVVVTNLFRTLMPIIRYPVGDLAEWVDDECRAFRLVGRTHEGARVANVAMAYVDVHAAILAADRDRLISGMQMVERRWDGKDGLLLRVATLDELPAGGAAELADRLVEAAYRARPLYPHTVADGHIHPLQVEWVRPGDLVTHARTGKLVQVVDERPHD